MNILHLAIDFLFLWSLYKNYTINKENERLKKKLEFIRKNYDLEDEEFIFDSAEFEEDI